MARKTPEEILDAWKKNRDERRNLDTELEDIADIIAPQRSGYTTQAEYSGRKRTAERFTSAASVNAQQLAVQLESLNTPKNEQWLRAKAKGIDDADLSLEARGWLDYFEEAMWSEIYAPSGGAQAAFSAVYFDLVTDGTSTLWAEEKPGTGVITRRIGLQNSWIDVNAEGMVDTLYIRECLTIRQLVGRYTEKALSDDLQRVARNDQDSRKRYDVISYCAPRYDRDPRSRKAEDMAYAYCVIEDATAHKIMEGGFEEQPFAAPRWLTVAGEVYGWSPSRDALPDVKSLNVIAKHNISGGTLRAVPPVLVANDGSLQASRIVPRGVLPYDPTSIAASGMAPAQWMDIRNDGSMGMMLEQSLKQSIGDIYLKYLLTLPMDGPQMTATEIIERKQQFIRMFAPIDGGLKSGLNRPYVERVANIMLRRPPGTPGALIPPPEELQAIEFEFESPVQKAIEEVKALAGRRALEEMALMIQLNPSIADNWNLDNISRDVPLSLGWPADWLHPEDSVASIRDQRAEQQAAQMQMQIAGQAAQLPGAQPAIEQALAAA